MKFKIKRFIADKDLTDKQTLSHLEFCSLNTIYTKTLAHCASVATEGLFLPYKGKGSFFIALKEAQEKKTFSPVYEFGIFDKTGKPLVGIAGNGRRAWDLSVLAKSYEPQLLFFVALLLQGMPKKKLFFHTLQEFMELAHRYMKQQEMKYLKLTPKVLAGKFEDPFLCKLFPRLHTLNQSRLYVRKQQKVDKRRLHDQFVG